MPCGIHLTQLLVVGRRTNNPDDVFKHREMVHAHLLSLTYVKTLERTNHKASKHLYLVRHIKACQRAQTTHGQIHIVVHVLHQPSLGDRLSLLTCK